MDAMRILALIIALCIFIVGLTMFFVKYIRRLFDDLWSDDDNGYFWWHLRRAIRIGRRTHLMQKIGQRKAPIKGLLVTQEFFLNLATLALFKHLLQMVFLIRPVNSIPQTEHFLVSVLRSEASKAPGLFIPFNLNPTHLWHRWPV